MKAQASIWDAYARAQKRADRRQIDHNYWAADQVADNILDIIDAGVTPITDRALGRMARNWRSTQSATERRRAAIREAHYRPQLVAETPPVGEAAIDAKRALTAIRSATTEEEWSLLESIGHGESQAEISERMGISEKAVECRVKRLRRRLSA